MAEKLPLAGFSVTIPHKQKIIRYLDVVDPLARRIGAVNTVWAYTYDFSEARMTREGTIPLPDHGVSGSPNFVGGAFYDYDPKYFRDTMLKDFRSPDYGKFNVIADVAAKVKARGMDFFA